MDSFYRLAGRLIEYYRKNMQLKYGNQFNVKTFCVDESGKSICSFPTYKKIAAGENVINEGFYYVLSNKLGIAFETFDQADEDFLYQFAKHYCDAAKSSNEREKMYFCDYYEAFFEGQKNSLVFREIWACLCLLRGHLDQYQNEYLDALVEVVNNSEFLNCIKDLR